MIKLKSVYMIAVYLMAGVVFTGLAALLFIISDSLIIVVLAGALLGGGLCLFLAAKNFVGTVEIDKEYITVRDYPFLSGKKSLKNSQLKNFNNCIALNEIAGAKLVKLTKAEKEKYIGEKHIFSEYIKFDLKGSDKSKYVYVAMYTKKQTETIIKAATEKK